jgi:hypothetical protein
MIDCNAILPEGLPVRFKISSGVYGTGRIRGIVSSMPGVKIYIVEIESDLTDYPYSCIPVPNGHLDYLE